MRLVFTRQTIRGLFQVVALSFLVLTAMDICSPEACAEELLGLPAALTHQAEGGCSDDGPPLAGDAGTESHDPSAPAHSGEEDCFCCCAHIITVAHFGGMSERAARHLSAFLPVTLPTGPPLAPFRPPRTV